ncbi:MAG: CoB--CoM heterodisulfide reductase iron-sulfur subunit B family protein [Desulfotomaculales bacterium]
MVRYSYYPGCSLAAAAGEYDRSLRRVCAALGVELAELADWNCCGATPASRVSSALALALSARNLALAQGTGLDLVVPCAACYNRLRRAEHSLASGGPRRRQLEELLDFRYTGEVKVISALEAVCRTGLRAIADRVRRPLGGLRVACYYGCLLVRPPEIVAFDDEESPVLLDKLMLALGATPVEWAYKTDCCGAGLALTRPETAQHLVDRLLAAAAEAGAEAVVTACNQCQINLETRRGVAAPPLPVFYFTELTGLAMEVPGTGDWFRRHLVDPLPLLRRLRLAG